MNTKSHGAMLAIPLALISAPAHAAAPEQLYERGPETGHFGLEYNGQGGNGEIDPRPHSLEIFAGVSDRIAIGAEIEGEVDGGTLRAEEYGVGALIGLDDGQKPIVLTLLLQAGIDRDGNFPQAQARLIAEHRDARWHWNANAILRHGQSDEGGTELAFAAVVHRRIGEHLGLGIEASGQAARLSGYSLGYDAAQFMGPSIQLELETENGAEFALGFKYLRRLDSGPEYRNTLRLFVGVEF